MTTNNEKLADLRERKEKIRAAGGEQAVERQHSRGKLTARERIEYLLDDGSFQEVGPFVTHRATDFGMSEQIFEGDSVVTGFGTVNGRSTFIFSQDFTILGGSLSQVAAEKITKIMDMAGKTGAPVIGIMDSGGARIQEGVDSLFGYGNIFLRNVLFSGVVPQISVVMGPAAGGAVYSPALTDFVIMERGIGQMFVTGPGVIKAVTGEEITMEELGGADTHMVRSGVAHFAGEGEEGTLNIVQQLLEYIPQNNSEQPPLAVTNDSPDRTDETLRDIIPDDPSVPYDMKDVIRRIVDDAVFMEVQESFAPNVLVGFSRMDGKSVGLVAQQPAYMAGSLDVDAADKAARFIRFCDCYNIPIVSLVDVPGFLPGSQQEYAGIIRHGAKMIYAYSEATVPKISVITRKAYGGAFIVMSSVMLRSDINYIWPQGEVAVMGADGAVNILYGPELRDAENPEERRAELVDELTNVFNNPYRAANRGYVDDVIDPAETRGKIIRALKMLENKRDSLPPKKHGNIPL